MNIGVSTGCFYPRKTIDCLQSVADLGAKYTEVFFNTDSELDKEYLLKLKEVADTNNVKIVSVHPYTSAIETFMFFARTDYKLEDSIKYYEKYFRACQVLGAKYVVIHGCHTTAEYMDMDRYTSIMNRLSQKAREYGVYVSQENVVKFKCGYIDNLKKFIRNADKDIRFVLDIKQTVRAQQDLWAMLDLMGDRISHIHISDHSDEYDSMIPGQGCFDFEKLFRTAEEKYNVKTAIIEIYQHNLNSDLRLKESLEMLQKLI